MVLLVGKAVAVICNSEWCSYSNSYSFTCYQASCLDASTIETSTPSYSRPAFSATGYPTPATPRLEDETAALCR